MALLNQDSIGFEFRFGRKPNVRSIKDIHDIWIKLVDRNKPRMKKHSEVWDEIFNCDDLKNERGERIVYYESKGDIVKKLTFTKDSLGIKSYTTDIIKKLDNKESDRKVKLDYFLASEKKFDLGKRFIESKKWVGKYHHRIKNIFIQKVCEELRNRFKDKKPDLLNVVKVGDYRYYFSVKDPFSLYLEFEFLGEVKDNEVEIF